MSSKQVVLRTFVLFCIIICNNTVYSQHQKQIQQSKPIQSPVLYKYKNKDKERTANFIVHTNDGGYILTGIISSAYTDTTPVFDLNGDIEYYELKYNKAVWIRKINSFGITEWDRQLGDIGINNGKCIIQTNDGGYILAGEKTHSTDVFNTDVSVDAYIVKLSKTGKTEWEKTLGGSQEDEANFIQQTTDSGYIMCGYSESGNRDVKREEKDRGNAWVVKLNKKGTIEWQNILGFHKTGKAFSIQQLADGGYIVAGNTNKEPDSTVHEYQDSIVSSTGLLLYANHNYGMATKISATGNIVWQKLIGDTMSNYELFDVTNTDDNGLILAGMNRGFFYNRTNDPNEKVLIVKLNSAGDVLWKKVWGDTGNIHKSANHIKADKNGGFIISGKITYKYPDYHKYYDTTEVMDLKGNIVGFDYKEIKTKRYDSIVNHDYIAKLDNDGNIIWQKILSVNPGEDCNNSLQKTNDGQFIIMGNKRSKNPKTDATYLSPYLIKFNEKGKIIWQKELD